MATKEINFNKLSKKSYSYNLKKIDKINLINFDNFAGENTTISASGSTLTVKISGKTLKFTNITNPNEIQFTGDYTNSLQEFYNEKFTSSYIPKKGIKVTGTVFDENIDVSVFVATGKNLAKNIGLTIKSGAGDDIIKGTKYNDSITGGAGQNTLNYSKGDGNDVVNLTKGENFILNMTDLNYEDLTFTAVNKNKDLEISYDKDGVKGSVTLKNFGSKDVTNNKTKKLEDSSSVKIIANGEEKDLRKVAVNSGNGTWHDDIINQSSYENKNNKGLTLDGKAGNDIITGTKYADTLKGGDGNDIIYSGDGNDKLYGNKGNDTINGGLGNNYIYLNKGDGDDIIENGDGTDTIVFAKGTNISYEYEGDNLILNYGNNDTLTLKNYKNGHSVQYIKIGNKTKTMEDFMSVPQPTAPTGPTEPATPSLIINKENYIEGTDATNNIVVKSTGTNRIFGGAGDDVITTGGSEMTINYVYGGRGNDIITSGAGKDIIYGGGGSNTIYLGKGSGADYTYDEADNTFVFKDISDLSKLTFDGGVQDSLGLVSDLTITGYGKSTDVLTIKNFFNLEGYDYSKIKLQAGTNGEAVPIYELVNKTDLVKRYFTGTWKASPKAITTSPAQKATQIDSVIYGNNPGPSSHNVLLGTAGGNNTFYSGGGNAGIAGTGAYGMTMIYGGDGDETFHAEGNKIYFNDNGTLKVYEKEQIFVINKADGTKEVKTGVFYRTPLGDEQPYATYKDYYNESHNAYYTEDPDKITKIPDDDKFGTGFICEGTNELVNCITPSTGELSGGAGNDTFYTSYGATGGEGNDVIYGSGDMYGGRGDDKFLLNDSYNDGRFLPMYAVHTNSGNDYIDTTGISAKTEQSVSVNLGEGVNTLVVDGSKEVNISVATSNTYWEEGFDRFIETRYLYQDRNTHYTAFIKGKDLYIATNNGNQAESNTTNVAIDGKGAGVLIIKNWTDLSEEQQNKVHISYRESHVSSAQDDIARYTINEFLKIIDGTSDTFIGGGNGKHKYINEYGNERINETYTFSLIDNSNGALSTINENGITQTATRNLYNGWHEPTGETEQRSVDYFIIGGKGAQTIKGGDGNDVIFGDNINGHDNNGNYISSTANDGVDTIYGGKGNDYIIGGGGNDVIDSGSGTDYIDGGDGNDTLIGGTLGTEEEFNNSLLTNVLNLKELHGGKGNDTIYSLGGYTDGVFDEKKAKSYQGGSTYFTNNIYGGDGDDTVHANGYRDVVYGGKGNDTIYSYVNAIDSYYNSNATSEIFGEEGDDHIILKSNADVRVDGGDGNDIIDARESKVIYYNSLNGGKGDDTIYGSNEKDIIYTGFGDNYVEAGDGDDEIYGSDSWLGRGGSNIIHGGAGDDYIRTSVSSKVYGEAGNDTIFLAVGYNNEPSNLFIDGGDGDDTYITSGGFGFDTIVASKGNDVIQLKDFDKSKASCQYRGNDLVISYTNEGYPAGLILKDYKLGGFENFTVETYGGYNERMAQNGQYSMSDFVKYLNNKYSMAQNGTNGDDRISSTNAIDGLKGNDFIIACGNTSNTESPQVVNTGSGNNEILATGDYATITGGTGNDVYTLRNIMATVVDEGGNNTVNIERNQYSDNAYYDITLKGNGNNTITGYDAAYKITATGSGKQTINVYSWASANHLETNENLYTHITTGSGDDDITLYEGTVNSGAGADTITVRDGASSGTYSTSIVTLNGEEGDDKYIIEGGYDWMSEPGKSVNTKVLIDDKEGSNTVSLTSGLMTHDNLHLLLNVTANGELEQFKHFVYNYEINDNEIVPTGYSGFIASDLDFEYAGTVATASYNGWDVCDGVKFADTDTMKGISKIEASDGYYISQTTISSITQNVAGWLSTNGYASVMDAINPGEQSDFNQDNYNTLYAMFNNANTWTQAV